MVGSPCRCGLLAECGENIVALFSRCQGHQPAANDVWVDAFGVEAVGVVFNHCGAFGLGHGSGSFPLLCNDHTRFPDASSTVIAGGIYNLVMAWALSPAGLHGSSIARTGVRARETTTVVWMLHHCLCTRVSREILLQGAGCAGLSMKQGFSVQNACRDGAGNRALRE